MTTDSLSPLDFKKYQDLLLRRSGLYYPEGKKDVLARVLLGAMRQSPSKSLDDYFELLSNQPSTHPEWDRLVSELTIGETYFFRNKGHFNCLSQHILPAIISQRAQTNRRIRIWSAGCATGEEPYSIAMLLREMIPNLEEWNILILATDINRDALNRAYKGTFSPWSFRNVEKYYIDRFFVQQGKMYNIKDEIRQMVYFKYLNLVEDHYPSLSNNTSGMDVIFCRNVTIYFSEEVTKMVVGKLFDSLVNGGWLIPGASEPNMVTYQNFENKNFPGAVVFQKPLALPRNTTPIQTGKKITASQVFTIPTPQPKPANENGCKPPAEPQDPFQAALELLDANRVDEAIARLNEKVSQHPDYTPALCLLGKLFANKGDMDKALYWFDKAIEKDRLQPVLYFFLSNIYQGHGKIQEAIEALKKTLFLDPNFILAHYTLGRLYLQQGKNDLANRSLRNVQRLLENKPNEELIPEGDGMVAGHLAELVDMALDQEIVKSKSA